MNWLACLLLALGSLHAQALPGGGVPFDWQARWQHYLHRTYSWERLGFLAADSAFEQLMGEPREWGRRPHSFAYRYSAGLGGRVVRNSIELGAGAALHEDIRFRPSGARTFRGRIKYAFWQAFTGQRDGRRAFAYSRLAGTAGGTLAISLWEPRPLTASRFFEGVGFGFAGHLQNSFLNEFSGDLKAAGRAVRRKIAGR